MQVSCLYNNKIVFKIFYGQFRASSLLSIDQEFDPRAEENFLLSMVFILLVQDYSILLLFNELTEANTVPTANGLQNGLSKIKWSQRVFLQSKHRNGVGCGQEENFQMGQAKWKGVKYPFDATL